MTRKMKRTIGVTCLLVAVILTQIPMPDVFAANGINDFHMNESTLAKYSGTAAVVSIPDTVKAIGEEAFARNDDIGTVTIGKNVKDIAFSAFAGCNYLTSVTLPDNLENLGDYAFSGCGYLSKVVIGPKLQKLGSGVFAGCNALKDLSIDKDNPYLYYAKGALYDDDKEVLYGYLNGYPSSTYKMPDTVTKIEKYSFWGNNNLESIQLSSYLQEIPGYAFSNCRSLRKISLPYSVNTIDAKAFENCISLTDVEIPPSVTYIDPTAFDGCRYLNIIAEEGTEGYTFFQSYKKKLEAEAAKDTEDGYLPGTDDEETTTEEEAESTGINASKDPSNVEYMPDRDVLEMPEDESVKSKSLVIGGKAVMFLDSKGVTVYESDNGTSSSNSNSQSSESQSKTSGGSQTGNVTVVGSIGSVLPDYVSESVNDEKIAMKSSNSSNKDSSPDTGDHSLPVNYVLAIGVAAIGIMFMMSRNKIQIEE